MGGTENGIKSMYVNSLACVRVKGGGSESFRINSGVRLGCIMSPWLFNVYMDREMKEVKMGMGWREVRMGESRDCLASCMQRTCFCLLSQKKIRGQYWDLLLRSVGDVSKSMQVRAR